MLCSWLWWEEIDILCVQCFSVGKELLNAAKWRFIFPSYNVSLHLLLLHVTLQNASVQRRSLCLYQYRVN